MKPEKKPTFRFSIYWMYAIVIVALIGFYLLDDNSVSKEVSFTEFEKCVKDGGVESITIFSNKNLAEAQLTDSMTSVLFPKQSESGSSVNAVINSQIPSSDKMADKIAEWEE